jgi:Polyketide cyclase / dehydrase and lipid transport
MTGTTRVSVSRTVEAPPSEVFTIVCDPTMHVRIDGSGMLQSAPDSRPVVAVGDTFVMEMDREPLGDLPMGKYQAINTVTRIEPDTLVEWNVGGRERGPFGHVYGWELTAVGDDRTEVTNYCDWSGTPDQAHDRFPIVPPSMMERSVERLAALVADRPARPG